MDFHKYFLKRKYQQENDDCLTDRVRAAPLVRGIRVARSIFPFNTPRVRRGHPIAMDPLDG
jgi:hypothetical protein